MLLKTSFILPYLFCNVSQHRTFTSEILSLKIEMLLEFENKTNVEITGF